MNVILPRYAGAIADSVVHEPVEFDVAVDEVSPRRRRNAAATKGDGIGCHAGAAELKAAAARPASPILSPAMPRTIPRAARPTAKHVPGIRFTAGWLTDAAHRDDPFGFGLLRLWPDLYVAFLWRAAHGRLCPVQFGDAGHRQAVRGYPRGGVQACRSRALRHHHHYQSLRADGVRRAARSAAGRNQRRADHRHRCAGLWRADPCRSQGRAGGAMLDMPARRSSRARCRRRASGKQRKARP